MIAKEEDVQLIIVGKGRLKQSLEQISDELNIREKVVFLGVREDIPALLSSADAFVLSSLFEGYGLVVAEAMACELPVVVTDSGGPGEIVGHDERAGYVVPTNSVELLANKMLHMMQLSPLEREKMGAYGRTIVKKNYSLDHIVSKWESLYRCLNKK
jgi:glycosyltransferase involved in cell wall biosynthesis